MSYNGIGLHTPRGSGTSGYVQKSLSGLKREGLRQKREREAQEDRIRESKAKKMMIRHSAGGEIVDHDMKRLIEVKCMELRDKLEDDDVDDEEVEKQVAELRRELTEGLRPGKIIERNEEDGVEENQETSPAVEEKESKVTNISKDKPKTLKTEKTEKTEKIEKTEKTEKIESNVQAYVPRYANR